MNPLNLTLKDIAWNHVRLKIPSNWEIGRIGTHQLIFQDDSKPTLELKWQTIKGTFSHRIHLKRLGAQYKGTLVKPIANWPLPAAWQEALSGFKTSGFSWRSKTGAGKGAVLFCPVCRRATLIQFFFNPSETAHHVPPVLLKTFQDHRNDGFVDWSVFDIRATLPESFKLTYHHFKPGNYVLEFSCKKQTIQLLRWAPASMLLKNQTLAQFGESLSRIAQQAFSAGTINGCPAIAWQTAAVQKPEGWLNRLTFRPVFQIWRIWHLMQQNRILGVKIEGKGPVDVQQADALCESYDSF